MKKTVLIILIAICVLPFKIYAQGCSDDGGEDGVKIIGFVQSEYQYQFLGDSVQSVMNGLDKPSSFYFNRARLGATGTIPYDFSYYFLAEFSPSHGGPYILDAFVTYKRFAPYFIVSMGQFKSQFGLELTTACHGLYSVNRSQVVNELASPFRDQGVLILGSTGDKKILGMEHSDIFTYRLAITNGQGLNKYDGNMDKDVTARLVFQPIEDVKIGGSFRWGKQKPIQASEPDDTRRRWGVDLSVEKANILFQAEYINGLDQGSSLVGGGCGSSPTIQKGDFNKDGFWTAIMYKFDNGFAPILKYQYYSVNSSVATIPHQTQDAAIVGFNYYFNDWTRLQLNYVITKDNLNHNTFMDSDSNFSKNFVVVQLQAKFN
ncbi:MAG: hypothetical protein B6I18_02550 [Bacteroidetes bacterium 4572_112]|nr:MAG: hypothetical protein B6I18_02550 [Bacteroidetes bacterium 4572_112]